MGRVAAMIVRVFPRPVQRMAAVPDPIQLLRQVALPGRIRPGEDSVAALSWPAAIWRQFEPSQDALAENGLSFLKKLLK